MQTLAFNTVDVFTTRPFCGNSLAIVHQADALTDQQMQSIAREFNLPETIFIQSAIEKTNTAKVRIFTPVDEIPFAGHPTIGCAIFLAEQLHSHSSTVQKHSEEFDGDDFTIEIRLEEQAGLVPVNVERKQGKISAELTAPIVPTPTAKVDLNSAVVLDTATAALAVGLTVADIDTDKAQPNAHTGGPAFIFVPLNSQRSLSQAQPVEPMCTQLSHTYGATGIYVYYLNESSKEIDARMFAPATGIPEDPATGSATAILASQLQVFGQLCEGNSQFTIRQGYDMGRPSDLLLNIDLVQGQIRTVRVSGSSTNISSGYIRIPER